MVNFIEWINCVIYLNDLVDIEKLVKDVVESVLLVNVMSVGMYLYVYSSFIENYVMI